MEWKVNWNGKGKEERKGKITMRQTKLQLYRESYVPLSPSGLILSHHV